MQQHRATLHCELTPVQRWRRANLLAARWRRCARLAHGDSKPVKAPHTCEEVLELRQACIPDGSAQQQQMPVLVHLQQHLRRGVAAALQSQVPVLALPQQRSPKVVHVRKLPNHLRRRIAASQAAAWQESLQPDVFWLNIMHQLAAELQAPAKCIALRCRCECSKTGGQSLAQT